MILAFGSIFAGYYTKDMFVGFGSPFFGNSVYSNLQVLIIDFEFLDFYYKNIPLVVSCSGIIAGVILLKSSKNFSNVQSNIYRAVYRFLNKKWYFDQIVNEFIVHKLMAFAYRVSFLYVDKGIIEYLAPSGVATTTNILKKATSFYNTGLLNHYIVVILCFIV
jgi:NADH-ubiquinone oxidoreductase chain 5